MKVKRKSLETIRKKEILEAALPVIAEHGTVNVTLSDIAKASGFSKGGITYYYSSKEVLFKNVFIFFFKTIFIKTQKELNKHDNPLDKMFSYTWFFDDDDPQTMLMYPLMFDLMAIASYDAEYQKTFENWVDKWVTTGFKIVQEGKEKGIFKIDDVEFVTRTFAATTQGIVIRWYHARQTHSTEWAIKALRYCVISILNVNKDFLKDDHLS